MTGPGRPDGPAAPVRLEERTGGAAELHADDWPHDWPDPDEVLGAASPASPVVVRWCRVLAPAIVLGSAQDAGVVDDAAAGRLGVAVARRRSGGGVVLLVPGECTWVDVHLPAADPRWDPRVDRGTWWLGDAWVRALADVGTTAAGVHRGGMEADDLGRLVCFAGRGPGEVLVGPRKVVGISQRRTRRGARFQCLVPHVFDAAAHAALLRAPIDEGALADRVHPVDVPAHDLVAALVDAIGAAPPAA